MLMILNYHGHGNGVLGHQGMSNKRKNRQIGHQN